MSGLEIRTLRKRSGRSSNDLKQPVEQVSVVKRPRSEEQEEKENKQPPTPSQGIKPSSSLVSPVEKVYIKKIIHQLYGGQRPIYASFHTAYEKDGIFTKPKRMKPWLNTWLSTEINFDIDLPKQEQGYSNLYLIMVVRIGKPIGTRNIQGKSLRGNQIELPEGQFPVYDEEHIEGHFVGAAPIKNYKSASEKLLGGVNMELVPHKEGVSLRDESFMQDLRHLLSKPDCRPFVIIQAGEEQYPVAEPKKKSVPKIQHGKIKVYQEPEVAAEDEKRIENEVKKLNWEIANLNAVPQPSFKIVNTLQIKIMKEYVKSVTNTEKGFMATWNQLVFFLGPYNVARLGPYFLNKIFIQRYLELLQGNAAFRDCFDKHLRTQVHQGVLNGDEHIDLSKRCLNSAYNPLKDTKSSLYTKIVEHCLRYYQAYNQEVINNGKEIKFVPVWCLHNPLTFTPKETDLLVSYVFWKTELVQKTDFRRLFALDPLDSLPGLKTDIIAELEKLKPVEIGKPDAIVEELP